MSRKRGLEIGGILIIIVFTGYMAVIASKPQSEQSEQQPTKESIDISKDSIKKNPAAKIYQKVLKNHLNTKQELLLKKSRI